jgi:plastocyanin
MVEIFFAFAGFLSQSSNAWADGRQIEIVVNDGKFTPSTIEIASGEKVELIVKNDGHEAEEFESIELKREKVVPPGKSVTVKIGPLKAGSYSFFGDFHPDTARGKIDVK